MKSQLQTLENTKKEISTDLNKSNGLLCNQTQLKRNIDDNLIYRKTKSEVEVLAREIETLEDKILNIGGISSFEGELERHKQEKERILSEVIMFYTLQLSSLVINLLIYFYFFVRCCKFCQDIKLNQLTNQIAFLIL